VSAHESRQGLNVIETNEIQENIHFVFFGLRKGQNVIAKICPHAYKGSSFKIYSDDEVFMPWNNQNGGGPWGGGSGGGGNKGGANKGSPWGNGSPSGDRPPRGQRPTPVPGGGGNSGGGGMHPPDMDDLLRMLSLLLWLFC